MVGLAKATLRGGADSIVMMGRLMGFLPDLKTVRPLLGTSAAIGGSWALPLTARWLMLTRKKLGADAPLIATNGACNGLDVARVLLADACTTEKTSAVSLAATWCCSNRYLATRGRTASEWLGLVANHAQTYQEQISRQYYRQVFALDTD